MKIYIVILLVRRRVKLTSQFKKSSKYSEKSKLTRADIYTV